MDEQLSEALLTYLGAKRLAWPSRDADAVTERYSTDAPRLIAASDAILDEFNAIPVDWNSGTEEEVTQRVLATIAASHPELSQRALNGLSWQFWYTWK